MAENMFDGFDNSQYREEVEDRWGKDAWSSGSRWWQTREVTAEALAGLGEMYVADPRFAENYDKHGAGTAEFVRDAMIHHAASVLG